MLDLSFSTARAFYGIASKRSSVVLILGLCLRVVGVIIAGEASGVTKRSFGAALATEMQ